MVGRSYLRSLARRWQYPALLGVEIRINPRLKSTVGRWNVRENLIELNPKCSARRPTKQREIVCHEAAHIVVRHRYGSAVRPHGPEWCKLVRLAGFSTRATLVRCGERRA